LKVKANRTGLLKFLPIKPTAPLDVDRAAGEAGNRADPHIAIEHMPAIDTFGIATAGELGHGP
jgi:hypothetical protein